MRRVVRALIPAAAPNLSRMAAALPISGPITLAGKLPPVGMMPSGNVFESGSCGTIPSAPIAGTPQTKSITSRKSPIVLISV